MEPKDYQSALTELQEILLALQNEQIPIDTLAERAERAKVLIQFCSQKLRRTDEQLNSLFGEEDKE
jgi:exodeoxyribonuclease VII small subunit